MDALGEVGKRRRGCPCSNASAIHADVRAALSGAPSYPHCKGARGVADEMPVRQRGLRRPSRASVEALIFERNPSRVCVHHGEHFCDRSRQHLGRAINDHGMQELYEITIPSLSMTADFPAVRHRLLADFPDVVDVVAMTTPSTVLVVYTGEQEVDGWTTWQPPPAPHDRGRNDVKSKRCGGRLEPRGSPAVPGGRGPSSCDLR